MLTFEVKVEDKQVYLKMPRAAVLNTVLGTEQTMITSSTSCGKPHLELSEKAEAPLPISDLKGCGSVACGDGKLDW